jgi:orotate phosphoribosyltransferase
MTEVLMSKEEAMAILQETGAIRKGHFKLPTGEHTNHYFQLPLALRYFNYARRLSVALSRLLRLVPQVLAQLPHVSVVGASTGGIPVAYGVREALQAEQIMWAEKGENGKLRFRQYDEVHPGENCILVDDLILTGRTMRTLIDLVEKAKGKVLAIGVLVNPCIAKLDFGEIPFVSLVEVPSLHFPNEQVCTLCKEQGPPTVVDW